MIIDAENLIIGRVGTFIAKKALMGEKIDVVNCNKAVIVGERENVLRGYREKYERKTPFKGPFIPKMSDRFVRRIIRGMLPYEKTRGREAFKRVMCWIDIPDKFKNEKIEKIDKYNVTKTKNIKYLKIEEVCKSLGGKA